MNPPALPTITAVIKVRAIQMDRGPPDGWPLVLLMVFLPYDVDEPPDEAL
jgi:hypothetical protein